MENDTLRALVVFANYPDGNWDPIDMNSNLIYMKYWSGDSAFQKPLWADSVICQSTTNVWDPSLTGLISKSSNGKFWLIGDVYRHLVILDSGYQYYTPARGNRIGTAVKEIINKIDPYINFADYDKFDPCDSNSNGNRHEPDGTVDFIFVIFRFIISEVTDGYGYTGIAALGGLNEVFGDIGDSSYIYRDNKKILAGYPGSGCLNEMYFRWMIGVPEHEFLLHYGITGGHLNGLGSHSVNGGGIACASDREHFEWTFGNIYQPASNTTGISLRDYVTTGDYAKILRNGRTYYLENRRRINFYSTGGIHSWRWTMNEPLLPNQRDSGIFIYESTGTGFSMKHAYGNWNFSQCQNGKYKILKTPYYNEFIPESVNRYFGLDVMDLRMLPVADYYCNTILNQYIQRNLDTTSYIGVDGDTNMCFDIDYNMVYSPWSNPGIIVNSSSDSLTIELTNRNSDGSLSLNVFFTNITLAAPSKPQFINTERIVISSPPDAFKTKLTWFKNKEPDLMEYKLYRGQVNANEIDASSYSYISTTPDTFFVDNTILYMHNAGSGPCERYFLKFVYRVTAVDSSQKESVKSDRDSMSGYTDPCGASEEKLSNGSQSLQDESLSNSISQNYPNPFNPLTRINYSVSIESYVSIKLYDITGRLMKVLINMTKIPGRYVIELNSDEIKLSSGIYFYKMEAFSSRGLFIDTKRLIILK